MQSELFEYAKIDISGFFSIGLFITAKRALAYIKYWFPNTVTRIGSDSRKLTLSHDWGMYNEGYENRAVRQARNINITK